MQYRTDNPRGRFPTSPGITGLRIYRPAGRCALIGRSRNADIALTGLPRNHPGITRPLPPYACRIFQNRSLCTFTHNSVFTTVSGLSPYCCYTCLSFHHTAVLGVRAFTVPLLYPYLNNTQTGLHAELSNYPPNTITKHLYLELNKTFYSLTNAYIRLSQDRSNN